MKPDRVRCCVPFCQRSRPGIDADGARVSEVICGPHWRAADPELRRRYNAERKRLAPLLARDATEYTADQQAELIGAWRWLGVKWGEIKRQAIEKAMGI